ncbi:hypothetical protein HYQ46_010290 [Verticillium longisporum]|nr:hypothetical protein HYQ46_010290 [Verticillium longisporum]
MTWPNGVSHSPRYGKSKHNDTTSLKNSSNITTGIHNCYVIRTPDLPCASPQLQQSANRRPTLEGASLDTSRFPPFSSPLCSHHCPSQSSPHTRYLTRHSTAAIMESFATLKRRTTDLLQSIPQNLPSMTLPNVTSTHAPATQKPKGPAPMKGTWEKIDIPPLPLSSHPINVVNGTAYIFGGDTQPGRPATNDMHVVTLPYNSAGADYYTIKAAPPKAYTPPPESPAEPETVAEAIAPAVEPLAAAEQAEDAPSSAKDKEKDLDDVPLASPTTGADPSFDDDDEEEEEEQDEVTPTTSASAKGKQPEEPLPPSASLPLVPGPRAGHATATLGHRIFLFGGRNPSTSQPLNEHGRSHRRQRRPACN